MKISVVVATNRGTYWQRFCDHLARNAVELEVIFVGPVNAPEAPLAVPTRFLYSPANPALAWEAGARQATGELLGFAADDVCYTPGFLDAAHAAFASDSSEFTLVTARYVRNNHDQLHDQRLLGQPNMPLLPVGGLSRTAAHHRLGGIDRRFRAVLWDTDLYQSFLEAGGRTLLLDGYTCHEVDEGNSTMFARFSPADRATLMELWFQDGVAGQRRNAPRLPYTAEEVAAALRPRP